MYVPKYYLAVRDKKDWSKWNFSPEFDTCEACVARYTEWIKLHPGAVISFMRRMVHVPDPEPAK